MKRERGLLDSVILLRVPRAVKLAFRQWASARGVSMSEILRAAILALLAEDAEARGGNAG